MELNSSLDSGLYSKLLLHADRISPDLIDHKPHRKPQQTSRFLSTASSSTLNNKSTPAHVHAPQIALPTH